MKCVVSAVRFRAVLDDRDYMRSTEGSFRRTITFYLIAAIVGLFFVQCFLLLGRFNLADVLALRREELFHGEIWRLLTFQFVHECPWPMHVLFNSVGLYFMGVVIEENYGPRHLLRLFFLGGTLGGLVHLATTYLPHQTSVGVIGASGGVLALLGAYATLNPWREMCFVFLFFPVRLRASVVLWFLLGMALFGIIFPFGGVSGAAHLGGLLFGIGYARRALGASDDFPLAKLFNWEAVLPSRRNRPSRTFEPSRSNGGTSIELSRPAKAGEPSSGDFISREVDPILDKISAHGIHSLTDRERKILEQARAAMAKRS